MLYSKVIPEKVSPQKSETPRGTKVCLGDLSRLLEALSVTTRGAEPTALIRILNTHG